MKIPTLAWVAALALCPGLARAEVFVLATIDKDEEKFFNETQNISKVVTLFAFPSVVSDSAAEQQILETQRNENIVIGDLNPTSDNLIDDEVGMSSNGVLLFNQSAGNFNNQANALAMSEATSPIDGLGAPRAGVMTRAKAALEQINSNNGLERGQTTPDDQGRTVPYTDTIGSGAFRDGAGVVGINQSANSVNNQSNSAAIALGADSVLALGELELGQVNTQNSISVQNQVRHAVIGHNSFEGFSGITMVNQSPGTMNNQANSVTIAITTGTAIPFSTPDPVVGP